MAQSLGLDAYNTDVMPLTWRKGWSEQDREVKRSNAIDSFIAAHYSSNFTPVTKDSPGRKFSDFYK